MVESRCRNAAQSRVESRRNFGFRRGISLTEVLIAMGILTVGLLGVAAVFPVGGWYMQRAEIADRGSAIGQSVMSDLMARGMLNPRSWYVMTPWSNFQPPANVIFPSDGKFSPIAGPRQGSFSRPFGLALTEALTQSDAATDHTLIGRQFGSAFVIDPLGISTMALSGTGPPPPQSSVHGPAALFPATAYYAFGNYANYGGWANSPWAPWVGGNKTASLGFQWPVRRVTFRQPSSGWQLDPTMAEHYFRGNDDLVVDLPARNDRPAMQDWDKATDNSGNTFPLARQWTGDYSWIVTVVPTTNAARDGMASNPEGFSYDVSVVVFYKRPLPDSADNVYPTLGSKSSSYLSAMARMSVLCKRRSFHRASMAVNFY